MKTIILAAGQGTRLAHLTTDRPKCMVSFLGEPLIYKQLQVFRNAGIADITMVTGYKASFIKIPGVKQVLNERFADTNMVYSLFSAASSMTEGEDLVISYGDIVFEPKVLDALLASKAPLSIVVDRSWLDLWSERMNDPLMDAETLKISGEDKIIELGKKPESYASIQGQYIGLIKIDANRVKAFVETWHSMDKDLLYDGKRFEAMYMTSYLQFLIDHGWEARAVFINNGWLEVDTVNDLEHYEQMHRDGRLDKFYKPPKA